MHKNNKLGSIKFRELDSKINKLDDEQIKLNNVRTKEDVLKLFTNACESVIENNYNDVSEKKDNCNLHRIQNKSEQLKVNIIENKSKIKLNIVKEMSDCVSNYNTATKLQTTDSIKKIYSVVIGKVSTRKHKKWDCDGILEVVGKSAVLKDDNGKYIGKAIIKPETIEEGLRLHIGGKEIEIIELTSFNDDHSEKNFSQYSDNEIIEPPMKKTKLLNKFNSVISGNSLHFNYKPLIMPHIAVNNCFQKDKEEKIHEVSVDGCLASVLRPHQREGIVFLYKCIMGINNFNYKGAILADEMGLGKTLQCIALIWTLLKKGPNGKPVLKRVLIVAPSSLCGNWNKEFIRWLGSMKVSPCIIEGKNNIKNFTKIPKASILIISYEMLIRNIEIVNKLNFDLLICDEGHRLKNNEVKTIKLLDQLNCKRRILLTGTPIQNDLQEFYTLSNFVNPGILGEYKDFKNYYEQVIITSHYNTNNGEEILLGQQRAKELHERSKTFILRRTNNLINQYLPQKHEVVVFCRPTEEQSNLYSLISDYWFNRSIMGGGIMPLTFITSLKKICNHPYFFTSEQNNIFNEVLPSFSNNSFNINLSFSHSSKIKVVQAIFQALKETQEKLVIVSYFTQTLDFLEKLCNKEGLQFCRLDGNTATALRTKIVERFNSKDNQYCRIFLLSAKAGGIGLNLIGASRLILFDSDWNPASDAQAMARIWRDGQKRSVYIYRLLTTGTIEEKIYQRQISKSGLSDVVIDANSISSLKFSADELKNLFILENNTLSTTHDLMECSCRGCGDIPCKVNDSSFNYSRDCQFNFIKKHSHKQITVNQLYGWQHYKQPFSFDLMKELMLQQVQECVTFIFKNTVKNLNN